MRTITMPVEAFDSLAAGFVRGTADFMVEGLLRPGRPRLLHPGDGFGRVLAWAWREQGEAAARDLVTSLLNMLRRDHPRAHEIEPAVTLAELTTDLRLALPGDMPARESDELLAAVRRRP